MDDDDLDVQVKRENIKEISVKELVFEAPLIKLHTVFQILQESDLLTQKKQLTVTNTVQEQE